MCAKVMKDNFLKFWVGKGFEGPQPWRGAQPWQDPHPLPARAAYISSLEATTPTSDASLA